MQAEAQPQPRWDRGAFFDVDGTLVSTNVAHAYAYYVFNRGTILGALGRIVKGLAMAPLYKAADLYNRARARGHDHPHAVRILARAWLFVIWRCWQDGTAYDPARHGALQRVLQDQQQVA